MIDIEVLHRVAATLAERKKADPDSSYVSSLYAKGTDAICKKVAEEGAETIMAAKDGDRLHLVWEVTDLWFHSLVLLTHFGLSMMFWPSSAVARVFRALMRSVRGRRPDCPGNG